MLPVLFHPSALAEQDSAVKYYNAQREGLGYELLGELEQAVERLQRFPEAYARIAPPLPARRCLVKRFPYGLIYRIEPDQIYILTVMHLHRNPSYWHDR